MQMEENSLLIPSNPRNSICPPPHLPLRKPCSFP